MPNIILLHVRSVVVFLSLSVALVLLVNAGIVRWQRIPLIIRMSHQWCWLLLQYCVTMSCLCCV